MSAFLFGTIIDRIPPIACFPIVPSYLQKSSAPVGAVINRPPFLPVGAVINRPPFLP